MAQITLIDKNIIDWDLSTDVSVKLTATVGIGNIRTMPNAILSSAILGENYQLVFIQDSIGNRSIAFESDYKVFGEIDKEPNNITIVSFIYHPLINIVILTSLLDIHNESEKETFISTASQTIFVLSNIPSNVDVFRGRRFMLNSEYSLSGNEITTTTGMPVGTIITVRKF